jgi:Spy/CpxP family protein refolding chaperone
MTPWAKRLAVALTISIAVNLLLTGYLVGNRFRNQQSAVVGFGAGSGRGMGMGPGMGNGRGMGKGLGMGNCAGRGRPAIRAAIEPRENELSKHREAIAKARDVVRETLGRDPLDRGAAEQALLTLRLQSQQGQEATHHAIVEAAARATPEQRRELANEFGTSDR